MVADGEWLVDKLGKQFERANNPAAMGYRVLC